MNERWGMRAVQEVYHNGLRQRLAAAAGALGTIVGLVSVALPSLANALTWQYWFGLGLLFIGVATVLSIPRGSQVYTHEQGGWVIELVRGDVLDYPQGCVITADRRASTRLVDVGKSSLIGQVVTRWYEGDDAALAAEVQAALARHSLKVPLPLGQLVPIGDGDLRRAWLFCLAERTSHGSRTDWRDLSVGYARLWDQLRTANLSEVTCPIIGAGFAGTSLSARGTLTLFLLGFHGSSLERRVTRRLRVVVAEADFDPRMYRSARAMLGELGYSH